MQLEKTLVNLGLELREALVYLACLELGTSLASEISRKSGFKRSNTYHVLNSLKEKGLISSFIENQTTYFLAEDPQRLVSILDQKRQELEGALPELKLFYHSPEEKPRIKFYEGVKGIKAIMQDVLDTRLNYCHCDPSERSLFDLVGEDYVRSFIKRKVNQKTHSRIIAFRDTWITDFRRSDPRGEEYRQARYLPPGLKLPIRQYIYGKKTAILSLIRRPIGIIIESQEIAQIQQLFFDTLWEKCEN